MNVLIPSKVYIAFRALVTRRIMAFSPIAFILLWFSLTATHVLSAAEREMHMQNTLEKDGLMVLQPSSPTFSEHLQELLDQSAIQKAGPLISKSLILVNNTGRYLWSVTVVYTYLDRMSPAGTPWKYVTSKTAARLDPAVMIAPGDSYLFTPILGFSAAFRPPATHLQQPKIDEGMERSITAFADHDSTADIEAAVDSVIFDDGTLLGPDTNDRVNTLNSKARAEREVQESLINLHGDNAKKQLLYFSTLDGKDLYTRQRRDHALLLLRVFTEDGEAAGVSLAQAMYNKKQIGEIKRR